MSEHVALRLPLPGTVVTWLVTGSRTTSLQMHDRRSWRTRVRHDHSAMTGELTGIRERALPLPVKVRPPRWPPRPAPGWAVWTAIVRTASADSSSSKLRMTAPKTGRWKRLIPVLWKQPLCAARRGGTPRCGSTALRPALTGHGRRFPAGFGPRGGRHLAGCAFRFARQRHDAGKPLSGAKRTPRFAADLLKGKRDSLGG